MFHVKRWGDVSRETEQGRGDVSRETKEGGVPVSGGGLPFLPPAALAFSLLFCPHPPCPPSRREGGDQGYFMQGAPPLASPGLNPGGTGYFLPRQCFLPHPPRPPSRWEGGDFCFILPGAGAPGTPATEPARHWFAGGAPPLASPWLSPRGAGFFCRVSAFCPHPPDPRSQSALPGGKGEPKVISCKGLRPLHPQG